MALCSQAFGQDTTFTAGGDGTSWDEQANWNSGVPVAGGRAFINGQDSVVIDGEAAATGRLFLADDAPTSVSTLTLTEGTLDITGNSEHIELGTLGHGILDILGGTLTVGGNINMGRDPGQPNALGTVTIDGGTVIVGSRIIMGYADGTTLTQQLNMVSGSLTAGSLFVADNAGSTARVDMTGGTMNLNDLAIPTNFGEPGLTGHFQLDGGTGVVLAESTGGTQNQPSGFRLANGGANQVTGTMDIVLGTLILAGDARTLIEGYINDGVLTASGTTDLANFEIDYNVTNPDSTTVTALGGLFPGVSIVESDGSTDVSEKGPTSDHYTVILRAEPTADVTITVDPDDQTEVDNNGAGNPVQLTFTPLDWGTAQTVTVTAVDDGDNEGTHTSTLTHAASSADTDYDGIVIADVLANVTDNDVPGLEIIHSDGLTRVDEEGATSDTYTIALKTPPAADVTLTVDPDEQTEVNANGAGNSVQHRFSQSVLASAGYNIFPSSAH